MAQVDAGEWVARVVNYLPKDMKIEKCDVNYDYYIDKADKIIHNILHEGKRYKKPDPNQLTLW